MNRWLIIGFVVVGIFVAWSVSAQKLTTISTNVLRVDDLNEALEGTKEEAAVDLLNLDVTANKTLRGRSFTTTEYDKYKTKMINRYVATSSLYNTHTKEEYEDVEALIQSGFTDDERNTLKEKVQTKFESGEKSIDDFYIADALLRKKAQDCGGSFNIGPVNGKITMEQMLDAVCL